MKTAIQILIEKIQALPPELRADVDDFVDFLRSGAQDKQLTRASAQASQPAFTAVWVNKEDEVKDAL